MPNYSFLKLYNNTIFFWSDNNFSNPKGTPYLSIKLKPLFCSLSWQYDNINKTIWLLNNFKCNEDNCNTPCPSSPVRFAPVASPVDHFAEIFSAVPNYSSPANKVKNLLPHSYREFTHGDFFGKLLLPHWIRVFSSVF